MHDLEKVSGTFLSVASIGGACLKACDIIVPMEGFPGKKKESRKPLRNVVNSMMAGAAMLGGVAAAETSQAQTRTPV